MPVLCLVLDRRQEKGEAVPSHAFLLCPRSFCFPSRQPASAALRFSLYLRCHQHSHGIIQVFTDVWHRRRKSEAMPKYRLVHVLFREYRLRKRTRHGQACLDFADVWPLLPDSSNAPVSNIDVF